MEPAPILIPAVPNDATPRVTDVVAPAMGRILLAAFERQPLRLVRPSSAPILRYASDWFMSALYQPRKAAFRFAFPHRSGRQGIAASVASHWLVAALWATWDELDEQVRWMGWRLEGARPTTPRPAVRHAPLIELGDTLWEVVPGFEEVVLGRDAAEEPELRGLATFPAADVITVVRALETGETGCGCEVCQLLADLPG
ncbi:MAG: hypothetical protein AAF211_02430 [Myxococcota bacterium]